MSEQLTKTEIQPDPVQTVEQLLSALTNLRDKESLIHATANQQRGKIMTPEIKAALMDIDNKEAESLAPISQIITDLEIQVKHWCLLVGHSVKAKDAGYQAVWSKARVKWNNAALEGYASVHPAILQFRTTGDPSVSIRKVKR